MGIGIRIHIEYITGSGSTRREKEMQHLVGGCLVFGTKQITQNYLETQFFRNSMRSFRIGQFHENRFFKYVTRKHRTTGGTEESLLCKFTGDKVFFGRDECELILERMHDLKYIFSHQHLYHTNPILVQDIYSDELIQKRMENIKKNPDLPMISTVRYGGGNTAYIYNKKLKKWLRSYDQGMEDE